MIKKTAKKGQHEILGFVMIIVIIAVIGVIFLGISLRQGRSEIIYNEDAEITNFLSSSTKYTTDCILKEPLYADMRELISGCYSKDTCKDSSDLNREACSVLNKTYSEMLDIAWPAGSDRPIKYYKISFYFQKGTNDPATKNVFMEIESGNKEICVTKRSGRQINYKPDGSLIVELEICK